MPEPDSREFMVGPLRLAVEYRRTLEDEGPSVRVFGVVGGQERQVLRFDCFSVDPHYHYDPDGRNELHHMRDEGIEDSTEWTLHRIERNLSEMIRRAGFGSLADQVVPKQVAEHLAGIRDSLPVPVA